MSQTNKVVYLVTTFKCSACKCMESILKQVQIDNPAFIIKVVDFEDVPDWIKNNVQLTDFPTTILVKDDVIKYHFVGTLPKKIIEEIISDIKF